MSLDPTFNGSLKYFITYSYLNLLLIFIPFAIVAKVVAWPDPLVFCLNFLAIVPLANLFGVATEQLALSLGNVGGAIVNATFGNAVELIVGFIALKNGQIDIVQASLLGSILSNLLLVQGCSFLFGGLYHQEQSFNPRGAGTSASMLVITMVSFLVPAFVSFSSDDKKLSFDQILKLSHWTAVVMLVLYILYLGFQLLSHPQFYRSEQENDQPDESKKMTNCFSVSVMSIMAVLVAICSDYLVGSIQGLVTSWNISKTFIGIVIIPIVGNAAEHFTAVYFASKNKMDESINIAVGSSLQIALGMTPLLVLCGWIMHQPMTLLFDPLQTGVIGVVVFVVNFVIIDGKSNWLEGAMLLGTYAIISFAFFLSPNI